MAGSPQSTLCAWSASSNKGSPNGPSLVSSPPTLSPLEQRGKAENPRDMLHEAAGQVMRLRLDELGRQGSLYEHGILRAHMTSPIATAPKKAGAGFFAPNPVLSQQEIQTAHVCIVPVNIKDLWNSTNQFVLHISESCLHLFL